MMKGVESNSLSWTDNGGKRFEEVATCPDDMAVIGSKSAQQARKGCSSLPPDAGETNDTGSCGILCCRGRKPPSSNS